MPDRGAGPVSRQTRVIAVLLALACVVVAGIGVKITDNLDTGEVVRNAQIGEATPFNGGTLTVTKVTPGMIITDSWSDNPLTTNGMFLMLRVKIEAPDTPVKVGGPGGLELRAGERVFRAFGSNTAMSVKAGNVGTGDMMFEVDPRHLADAYVDFKEIEIFSVTPAVVRVHLGITEDNAAQWYASAKGRSLEPADVEEKPIP
ncbi:MAG TPA: hypothetical protein VIP98_12030 [Microlunatus sp.]